MLRPLIIQLLLTPAIITCTDTPIDVPECGARLTFMEANHCPGAAIILIENTVTGQALLHTGDFRFTPAMLDYPPLKPFLQTEMSTCRRLAAVYLDTTYCDPRYRLPTQEDTVNAVVNEVRCNGIFCSRIPKAFILPAIQYC